MSTDFPKSAVLAGEVVMSRRIRGWLLTALLTWMGLTESVLGQETAPLPQPLPPEPPALSDAPALPSSASLSIPSACAPFEDRNGPLLKGDLWLDRPDLPPPGWFGAAEVDILGPSLRNRLVNEVNVGGIFTDTVHLPSAPLNWVAAPRFELGYRFSQGAGALMASYYGVNTRGNSTIADFDPLGAAALHSRLETNVVDLDYGNYEYAISGRWLVFWKIGGRLSQAFFDSRATGALTQQHTSNFYLGAGPHAGLDLRRNLDVPGLQLFGRIEAGGNIGRLTQNFEETFAAAGVPAIGGATKVSIIQWMPNMRVMAGVAWMPRLNGCLTFSGGYLFDGWWSLGEAKGSSATLTLNGVFLRAECRY